MMKASQQLVYARIAKLAGVDTSNVAEPALPATVEQEVALQRIKSEAYDALVSALLLSDPKNVDNMSSAILAMIAIMKRTEKRTADELFNVVERVTTMMDEIK